LHDPSADDAGARLREQLDRLQERVRAMQDILEIISRSREEESPVFNAILGSASRLCDAPMAGLHIADEARTSIRLVAHRGLPEGALGVSEFSLPIDSLNTTATATREGVVVHTEDLADDDLYRQGERNRVAAVDVLGARSTLVVPLLSQGLGIGCIWIFRREVRPYTEDEIALLQSFAAQAVIAIENVRQFRELQNRLDREAATREILQVISRSRDDEQPVFKVILENAARLCDAPNAYLHLCNAERTHLHVVAHAGTRHAFLDYLSENPLPLDGSISQSARAVLEKTVLHEEDLADDELYRLGERYRVRAVDVEGIRTFLCLITPLPPHCSHWSDARC